MRALLYTIDFALKALLRQKTKNLSIVALFGLIVFLFSGIDFMSNALYHETLKALAFQPSLIIQDVRAGRQVPISLAHVEDIAQIPGVSSVKGRVWGYYFDPFTGANYTIVGDSEDLTELWDLRVISPEPAPSDAGTQPIKGGEALVGEGVIKLRRTRVGGVLNFQDYAGHPVPLKVRGTFSSSVSLWAHDLILLTEEDARRLFGLDPGSAWDLAVYVPNEFEVPKVGEKILRIIPGARVIATNQLKRTYGSSYGFRSGLVLSLNMTCLLAFLILAYDRVASPSQEEQREIAILKATGWQTSDVIRLNMLQSLILSLTGFLVGVVASYCHVFIAGAPLLRIVFAGWSVLYPPHPIPPSFDISKVFGLMFLTVVPYIAVGILPVWRAAVRDPEEVFRS
ncbi:ABC transporter permease [Desulfomonile tiedjei]|uniref:ABC-type transport system, involved in lipoprotein release, permease component n=1 Tax=Desulfomonile tiedjei (strain ATCC 49306 / DSM 6799 / DCB-1) TaxID=706587 RepID=I4C1F4_DESTA|nr:FtsX-like permease family protein [Desulfomonile tiedjei]AFM23395.1 ABC-type transport system, involved in lipoprotein release, permease component [Desulfomonile tiedjei DSM 6799]